MCSIAGIADFHAPYSLDETAALKMGATMKMRGPDDSDIIKNDFSILHHNRLAVMDVEKGHQPMTIKYKGNVYSIVYNGEIYNTDELRHEFEMQGFSFNTNCDTEVVLVSYIVYGEDAPKYLNGIFAFTISDEKERKLFFARDRFGIKPFFFSLKDTSFIFASEIKALLSHPSVSASVNREGLWQLLFMSPCKISGSGIFADIAELKPAHCGTFTERGIKIKPYWHLKAESFTESRDEAIEHTRFLLEDAIGRQLKSDVPLCTFLSGGLDSSVITAVAAKECAKSEKKLSTYSFEYEDNKENFEKSLFQPQSDDEYAIFMAEFLGTDHTVLTAPTGLVASSLLNATVARDIPGQADIDSSLFYFCRQVKKRHTVALSGECSDEIFGGYPWFYRKEMLESGFFPWIHSPFARINLFKDSFAKKDEGFLYIKDVYKKSIESVPMLDSDSPEDKTARIATVLSTGYFMTSLLERKDRMSMASGLEVRVPFADHRILEYIYNVPWKIKFENNVEKALLRNAMKDYLPLEIYGRKKSPYPKTHNPLYEKIVTSMLRYRLKKGGILTEVLDDKMLKELMTEENVTWFGQLMGKPQLIAWLIQFDYWADYYGVRFSL
ncbi:MAG: asparagine synthase (glutamine-hydrolyzing) [Clostridia bacterium]|nr:asparagine synthase (glutamine-hydrolyzing) [Clostridia bacterium]